MQIWWKIQKWNVLDEKVEQLGASACWKYAFKFLEFQCQPSKKSHRYKFWIYLFSKKSLLAYRGESGGPWVVILWCLSDVPENVVLLYFRHRHGREYDWPTVERHGQHIDQLWRWVKQIMNRWGALFLVLTFICPLTIVQGLYWSYILQILWFVWKRTSYCSKLWQPWFCKD